MVFWAPDPSRLGRPHILGKPVTVYASGRLRAGLCLRTDLQQANGRLQVAQREVEEKHDAIRKNLGEREALLDRYEALLDLREDEL